MSNRATQERNANRLTMPIFCPCHAGHAQILMSSSSPCFGLLEAPKSSLVQLWPTVKDRVTLSISAIHGLM